MAAAAVLRNLIVALPHRLYIVLTEPLSMRHWFEPNGGGIQFNNHDRHIYAFEHIFDRVCHEHHIEHRLTKAKHPWNREDQKTVRGSVFPRGGQVERMNRTIKDATVKRFHHDEHDQLRQHLGNFISTYNFGRRLKTLKGLPPYEFGCKQWTIEPERFTLDPIHQMPGLNTLGCAEQRRTRDRHGVLARRLCVHSVLPVIPRRGQARRVSGQGRHCSDDRGSSILVVVQGKRLHGQELLDRVPANAAWPPTQLDDAGRISRPAQGRG